MTETGHASTTAQPGGTVPLFATPFAAVNTGTPAQFNERLARRCESQRAANTPPDDVLAATDAVVVELRGILLGHAAAIVAGLNHVDRAAFATLQIQAQGWCSIVPRDGHVAAQHFPGASWLAVYCVQAGESDAGAKSAGVLRLYERRLGSMYRDASTRDLAAPWRFGNHTWSPSPGWLALFPAHVPHEVSVVRSDTPLILIFAKLRFLDAVAPDGVHR